MEKKVKDKIEWFGEKGKEGTEIIKIAAVGVTAAVGLAIVGAALGTVNHAFGWNGN
jgi:hypothetical protein